MRCNDSAQAVYRGVGARLMDEWTVWRVDGEALATLGPLGPVAR